MTILPEILQMVDDDHSPLLSLRPAGLFGFPSIRMDMEPEEANQLDLYASRLLFLEAFAEAAEEVGHYFGRPVHLESKRYLPNQMLGGAMGGGADGTFELLRLVIGPEGELVRDIASQLIATWIAFSIGKVRGRLEAEGGAVTEHNAPSFKPRAILALCDRHAHEHFSLANPGPGEVLKPVRETSDTSISPASASVVVRSNVGEVIYVIDHLLTAHAIMLITQSDIQLLDTDGWNRTYSLVRAIEGETNWADRSFPRSFP